MKDSFIFYRSFQDAIDNCPIEEQLSLYKAITKYALDRVEPTFEGIKQVVWVLIKPQLDANWKRFENGCKGGKFGNMGGAPKGNNNAKKNNPKTTPNVNVNVFNDNDNVNKESIEKAPLSTLTPEEESFFKFNEWLKLNAPYCNKNLENLTLQEFNKLKEEYSGKEIADTILQIENRKDLRKKYSNLYRTLLNWLKKGGNDNGK